MTGGRGDARRASHAWFADRTKEQWAELAEKRGQEIIRLRGVLRSIRGWREIGRDDRMRAIEEMCDEALGQVNEDE